MTDAATRFYSVPNGLRDEPPPGGRMDAVQVDILVLNFDGDGLLAECLPSIVEAARRSRHNCRVVVVDNGSTDGSLARLNRDFPTVGIERRPNDGLCSYNAVLRDSTAVVALLLNNDVKAAPEAVDPLVDELLAANSPAALADGGEPHLFVAPRCFLFDGTTLEGLKTAVQFRCGLVSATALFSAAETVADVPGPTASAGCALAVDRRRFLELGGFDPLFLPGRIEDLDLAFRGFVAGYVGRYVPQSIFYHRGAATFDAAFGRRASDRLALRNTLLFQRKNLRSFYARSAACLGQTIRVLCDLIAAPFTPAEDRWAFIRTLLAARALWRTRGPGLSPVPNVKREREFFARHSVRRLVEAAGSTYPERVRTWQARESARDADFPISRFLWRPLARQLAQWFALRSVRPMQVTLVGASCAIAAALVLVFSSQPFVAALLIALAWLCDRTDGPLARLQQTATPLGAWIDANVDECVDLGLHVAAAYGVAVAGGSQAVWLALVGFLVGKYLLMHGLASDGEASSVGPDGGVAPSSPAKSSTLPKEFWRRGYHLPATADVRMHLLIGAVACGAIVWELAFLAVYYNVRWLARFPLLVARTARRAATGAGV